MVLTNFCFKFFYCHICEYCWGFISFLRFWHSKYHPKNCHSSLRKVWNQRNLLSLFQIHVNRFDKIVIQIFFVTVVNIFELMFSFQGVSTHRKKEKVTRASLNGCRIVYSCLHPLEYIIWFPLKSLFKFCFGNFQIFLKFCPLFVMFAPQKPLKNHPRFQKDVWGKPNLLFLFKIHLKVFDKVISSVLFVTFCNIFEVMLRFESLLSERNTQKLPQIS